LAILLVVIASLPAQEAHLPDWDFDLLFSEPPLEPAREEATEELPGITVADLLRRRGFTLTMAYDFSAGIAPGFYEAPWFWDSMDDSRHYHLERFFIMRHSFTIDSQVSEAFRVSSRVFFEIPNFRFAFGEFFFDYNFYDTVFIRSGMFSANWGISQNYNFTNLLRYIPPEREARPAIPATPYNPGRPARPRETFNRTPLIFRADIPSGIGGLQLLALTRANVLGNIDATTITREDVGFGGRYNFTFRQTEFDMGMFYQESMPFRTFLSVSTSFRNTDWYSEGMLAFDEGTGPRGAVNFGFTRFLLNGNFIVNGELFYNATPEARFRHPGTPLLQDGYVTHFIEGLNVALNLFHQSPHIRGNPRLALQYRFALSENSGLLIPSFRIEPWQNIELLFAVPMALGSRGGYYYRHTMRIADTVATGERRPIPFSVMMLVSLRGSVTFRHDY